MAQSLINKTLIWDGNTREYSIYIPAGYDGSVGFPLLFNFHGGGDNVTSYMKSVDMRPIADTANFILVFPQAFPDPTDGGSTNWIRKPPTTFDDVPFVGAILGAIFSIGFSFIQFETVTPILLVAAIFLVGQVLEGNFLTPKLIGEAVGLHPVWVIFALLTGATLFGFLGILLALPIAVVVTVLIRLSLTNYFESEIYSGKSDVDKKD